MQENERSLGCCGDLRRVGRRMGTVDKSPSRPRCERWGQALWEPAVHNWDPERGIRKQPDKVCRDLSEGALDGARPADSVVPAVLLIHIDQRLDIEQGSC